VPGGYRKVLETLEACKDISVPLTVSFTICPENHRELPDVFALSLRYGAAFTFRLAASSFFYNNDPPRWTPEDLDAVEDIIGSVRAAGGVSWLDWFKHLVSARRIFEMKQIDFARKPRRMIRCHSGFTSFYLDPFGDVFPCIMLQRTMGNIKETSLDALWCSERAEAVRSHIRDERCFCWTDCETLPAIRKELWRL